MFTSGFKKISYDYAHEVRQDLEYRKQRAKDKPVKKTKASLIGAGIGGIAGSIGGGLLARNPAKGAAIGAAAGAGLGGLGGLLYHYGDVASIDEAKRINKMPMKQRKEYLASLAREKEIAERELNEELRHQRLTYHLSRGGDR